jgi:molybdate transport system substrate-binding protein
MLTKVMMKLFRRFRAVAAAILVVLATPPVFPAGSASEIVIFAAASLKEAMDEATRVYDAQTGDTVKVSYAASSALAKQIESGAPADIFISADLDWMDYLQQRNLIQSGTRKSLLGNKLVIVAPADAATTLDIKPGFDLAGALKGGHLAMADPDSVPAGKYGKAALEKLGVWNSVKGAVAPAESVRAALLFVSRHEAPLGIVYATDAAADPRVKVVGTFPADSHPPIVYPVALTADSKNPDAARLLAFLTSAAARPIFESRVLLCFDNKDSGRRPDLNNRIARSPPPAWQVPRRRPCAPCVRCCDSAAQPGDQRMSARRPRRPNLRALSRPRASREYD